jgi:hypothetical protein
MLYGRAAGSSYIGDHFDGTAHRGDDQCDLDSRYPMRRILILIPVPLTGTGRLAGVLRPFPGVAARNRGSAPSRVSYRSKFFHGSHDDWCRRLSFRTAWTQSRSHANPESSASAPTFCVPPLGPAGKAMCNANPPKRLGVTNKRPSCDWIIDRQIASPIPIPLGFVV